MDNAREPEALSLGVFRRKIPGITAQPSENVEKKGVIEPGTAKWAHANVDTPQANRRVLADSYTSVPTGAVSLPRQQEQVPA